MKTIFYPYFFISLTIFVVHFIGTNIVDDSYSLTRVFISLLLPLYLFFIAFYKRNKPTNIVLYKNFYIILFIYISLQTFLSPHINTQFEYYQQFYISVTYLLFITLFLHLSEQRHSLSVYLYFITIVSCLYLLVFAISFIFIELSLYDIILYYFKNIRFFNHLQTIIIPSLGLALLIVRTEGYRTIINIVLILNFMLLFETGGRGSLYAILFAYIFLYLTNKKSKHIQNNIIEMIVIFLSSLVLYSSIYYLFSSLSTTNHLLSFGSSGRLTIYKTIIPYIFDWNYFFTAIGFSPQDIPLYGFLHPHNLFLYVFLGAGSLGLIVFIFISLQSIYKLYKEYKISKSLIKRYLFIVSLALFTHSMVTGIYITPLTSLIILYLFLLLHRYYLPKKRVYKGETINIIFTIFLLIAVPLLTYFNYQEKEKYEYQDSNQEVHKYVPGVMLYSTKIFEDKKLLK